MEANIGLFAGVGVLGLAIGTWGWGKLHINPKRGWPCALWFIFLITGLCSFAYGVNLFLDYEQAIIRRPKQFQQNPKQLPITSPINWPV